MFGRNDMIVSGGQYVGIGGTHFCQDYLLPYQDYLLPYQEDAPTGINQSHHKSQSMSQLELNIKYNCFLPVTNLH